MHRSAGARPVLPEERPRARNLNLTIALDVSYEPANLLLSSGWLGIRVRACLADLAMMRAAQAARGRGATGVGRGADSVILKFVT